MTKQPNHRFLAALAVVLALALVAGVAGPAAAQEKGKGKKPNVVMLMSDDVGWGDYGCYYGGAALGHPTPNIDRMAKEGAMFTAGTARPVAPRAAPRS